MSYLPGLPDKKICERRGHNAAARDGGGAASGRRRGTGDGGVEEMSKRGSGDAAGGAVRKGLARRQTLGRRAHGFGMARGGVGMMHGFVMDVGNDQHEYWRICGRRR